MLKFYGLGKKSHQNVFNNFDNDVSSFTRNFKKKDDDIHKSKAHIVGQKLKCT